jgi:magnesium chelatase family protein
MLAKVKSAAVVGLEGAIVEVEVDLSPGLPSFTQVGTQYWPQTLALDPRL